MLVSVDSGEVVDLVTPTDVFPFRIEWLGDAEIVYTAAGSLWRQSLEGGAEARAIPFEATVTLDRSPYRRRDVDLIEDGEELPVRGIVRPVVSPDGSKIRVCGRLAIFGRSRLRAVSPSLSPATSISTRIFLVTRFEFARVQLGSLGNDGSVGQGGFSVAPHPRTPADVRNRR